MRRLRQRLALAVTATVVVGLLSACDPPPPGGDPPLTVPVATLNEALTCPTTFPSRHQPVLLVHGTFTNPDENWSWNYRVALPRDGYDVCWVTLPDRSLGDIQVASEYVVHAVRTINARSGRRVDIVGHSQGGLEPRWALRWWPSLLSKVDDLVTLATPNHGTVVADTPGSTCPACWQMRTTSNFIAALNSGDETPASVGAAPSYTTLYSLTDELVQPSAPNPTAALHGASNILVQQLDVCPGRPVDHVGFAYDKVVYDLTRDALDHRGAAVPARAWAGSGQLAFCAQTTIVDVPQLLALALAHNLDFTNAPSSSFVDREPTLRCYAGGPC